MRLLKLTSDKDSFHTVEFNPIGLTIILGKKQNQQDTDIRKTYNSVGKSLIIYLVHFCLGASKNKELEEKLPDWTFQLDFQINNNFYTSKRNTSEQDIILLDGKEYTITNFTKLLAEKIFNIPENTKHLSFRGLISRFIRPYKASYVSFNCFVKKEKDITQLTNNTFLLGLDADRVLKKNELREDYDKTEKLKKELEQDGTIRAFFQQTKDADIIIADLEEKIPKLQMNLDSFKIAQDFYQVKKEADQLSRDLMDIKNQASSYKDAILNIDKSLQNKPDIPKEKVLKMYEEASIEIPELIIKRLDEVESFNAKILKDRQQRLTEEKKKLEKKSQDLEIQIESLGKQKDQKLQYLQVHGALDEYTRLNQQLLEYRQQLEKLKTYKKLISEYKNKLDLISIELDKENIDTRNYLESQGDQIIRQNILVFKELTNSFYENKKAGIIVNNNEGNNKIRFEITANIDTDSGDGVNSVKLFCFDWTLLLIKHNHRIDFIFHDSRIFGDMDVRQRTTLFKVAYQKAIESNLQYIISANQDTIDGVKEYLNDEEFKLIITDNIKLELKDDKDENKLLGFQINLDYEQ